MTAATRCTCTVKLTPAADPHRSYTRVADPRCPTHRPAPLWMRLATRVARIHAKRRTR